jgi:hypothetical protein
MEKKVYITPECFVVELETVSMIAGSNINAGVSDSDIGDLGEDEFGANRRRGQWGDLWSE